MESEFKGLLPNKLRGNLGRRSPSTDSVFGLVAGGVAVVASAGVTGIALGQVVELIQLADAVALGINAAYDANNSVLVYHHIKRYFHYHPDGTLFLMLVAKGTTATAICDTANPYLKKLLTDESAAASIRCVGVVLNPLVAPAAEDFTNGLLTDISTAVPKAQALAVELASRANYVDNIMLEGILASTATIGSLPSLRALGSELVSVCAAADPAVLTANGGKAYAEIGSALGMLSIRKVCECIGSVDIVRKPDSQKGTNTYPLTNVANGYFLSAVLSNGKTFAALTETERGALGDKGYIYTGRFNGLDGVYFSDSHTCIAVSDDYAYIEDNRIWNKAARLLRTAMLPLFRGQVAVDAATGFLRGSQIAYYQNLAKKAVSGMATADEISGEPRIIIDPSQDVVGTGTVKMALNYVRNGVLRKLEADVAAINPAAN